jgi:hypothetical protein
MDDQTKYIFIFFGISVVVWLIMRAYRNGDWAMNNKPSRIQEFTTILEPQKVLKAIIQFAQHGNYQIDGVDESAYRLVLGDKRFYYPVFIERRESGETLVEVGMRSKASFSGPMAPGAWGPIATRLHDTCFNGVRAAVFAAQPELSKGTAE